MFNESASSYALPTPHNSNHPIIEAEASEPEMIREEDDDDYNTLEESPISFQLSGPNEELSRDDQQNEEPTSSEDSVVDSRCKELRRRLRHKEKGKKKMP